jgi:hypothetical protein
MNSNQPRRFQTPPALARSQLRPIPFKQAGLTKTGQTHEVESGLTRQQRTEMVTKMLLYCGFVEILVRPAVFDSPDACSLSSLMSLITDISAGSTFNLADHL